MNSVIDHEDKQRFELVEDGKLAFADYGLAENVLALLHVEADPALRGKGAAGRLMEGILQQARVRGLRIRPVCGYAATYIQRHPEHHDLLA